MPTTSAPGALTQLWYRWRALRLPWRRKWLVGHDLSGNTFWEFKDALNVNRFRRIMRHAKTAHYADIKISPQWHQWLRYTRPTPPTVEEQQYEVARQSRMKQLAAEADERWKSVPSFLDAPNRQHPLPAIGVKDPGGYAPQTEPDAKAGVRNAVENQAAIAAEEAPNGVSQSSTRRKKGDNPYQKTPRGAPSEDWQPAAWTPGVVQKR